MLASMTGAHAPIPDVAIERKAAAISAKTGAPRVTKEQIDALVGSLTFRFHRFEGTTSTVCAATLPNGFVLAIGHSACASPENFDEQLGREIAQRDAQAQATKELWKLEGYALKQRLAEEPQVKSFGPGDVLQLRVLSVHQEPDGFEKRLHVEAILRDPTEQTGRRTVLFVNSIPESQLSSEEELIARLKDIAASRANEERWA